MTEEWRDIVGYEGLYQVSNYGNVRSLHYRNTTEIRNLCLKAHPNGYLQIELHRNGGREHRLVHRLVALAFVEGYTAGLQVNHLDENKQNNKATNLEWCTVSDNTKYSLWHRRNPAHRNCVKGIPRKETRSVAQMDSEGNTLRVWRSPITIKQELGYSDWSIKECCRGNRKQAYGYRWCYAT